MGYARRIAHIDPNYNSTISMKSITKSTEPVVFPQEIANIFRRAFSKLRNGRGGPVLVEIPSDVMNEEIGDIDSAPVISTRYGPDPAELRCAPELLVNAKSPRSEGHTPETQHRMRNPYADLR